MGEDDHIIIEVLSPPPFLRVFGLLIGTAGVILLINQNYLGLLVIVLACFFFFPKRKKEIDLKKFRFRQGVFFKTRTLSKWKSIPKNKNYISVLSTIQKSTIHTTVGISSMSSTNVYMDFEVNLVYDKRKRFKLGVGSNFREANELANRCAKYLKLDIYVVKAGEKFWIRFEEL